LCGAPIIWVVTSKGVPVPLDAASNEFGTIWLDHGIAKVITGSTIHRSPLYNSHCNVCSAASEKFRQDLHSRPLDPQADPTPNDKPAVWDLVVKDMQDRDGQGQAKYGVRLQPFNGRDVLFDAYQEALDLCVYLRQAIYERDGK
jgi:hypothetical protein